MCYGLNCASQKRHVVILTPVAGSVAFLGSRVFTDVVKFRWAKSTCPPPQKEGMWTQHRAPSELPLERLPLERQQRAGDALQA